MCIIVCCPPGLMFSHKHIDVCWNNNPNGAGYMFSRGKKLYVKKGYFDLDSFKQDYTKDFNRTKKSRFVLHFRIATHGGVSKDTCHPFVIHDDLAFCHNGTISAQDANTEKGISDTMAFRDNVLSILPPDFLDNDGMVELIEEYSGGSKYAFMDSKGVVNILNGHLGNETNDGFWMSNTGWKITRHKFNDNRKWDYDKHRWVEKDNKEKIIHLPNPKISGPLTEYKCPTCSKCGELIWHEKERQSGKCFTCKAKYIEGFSRGRDSRYKMECSHCGVYLMSSERANEKGYCNRCKLLAESNVLDGKDESVMCKTCGDELHSKKEAVAGRCDECQDVYEFCVKDSKECIVCHNALDHNRKPINIAKDCEDKVVGELCTDCFIKKFSRSIVGRTFIKKG